MASDLHGLRAESFIRQWELSRAPVYYLIAHESSTPERWHDTGELLSALWVEATARDLAGTLCGRIDTEELERRLPGMTFQPAALCLGLMPR